MEFYKMDLHVHTPASKCYKGSKNDEEYFEILKNAHKQNLDIIAITDHNSIAGYERLMELRSEIENRLNILSEYKDSATKINDALAEYKEKLDLFDKLLILPGVEVTLNPGVHMLVIAPQKKVSVLSELLDSVGYITGKRGADCDVAIDVDIKNFLSSTLLSELMVIAPHIDSDKGIYNSLSGQFRGEIMRSEVIAAFSCNALSQKEKILSLMKGDVNYKRSFLPAFVNCSDAHSAEDVGTKFSYIKLSTLSYEAIRDVFSNPEDKISDVSDQRLEKTLRELIADESPVLISDASLMSAENLGNYICACLNSNINYILLGVTQDEKLVGIKKEREQFEELVDNAMETICSNYCHLRYSVSTEKLGNGNNIAIIYFESGVAALWFVEETEKVYIFDDDNIPKVASVAEIELLVHENTLLELGKIENRNNQTAANIGNQVLSLANTIDKYSIMQEVLLESIPLLSLGHIRLEDDTHMSDEIRENYFWGNGCREGNMYFVVKQSTRLADAILRYSCPVANVPHDISENIKSVLAPANSLIISQGGGMHIAIKEQKIVGDRTSFLIFTPREEKDVSTYILLAWLKSSLFIWYILKKYNTTNIFSPDVLRYVIVPYEILKDKSSELESGIKEIIKLEEDFLSRPENVDGCKKCTGCVGDSCPLVDRLKEHNTVIEQKAIELDNLIFGLFYIEDEKRQFIKDDLEAAGIFNIISEQ